MGKQATLDFIKNRTLGELFHRTMIGAPMFIIIWLILGWSYKLYDSEHAQFFFVFLFIFLFFGSWRIRVILNIRKTGFIENFHQKYQALQTNIVASAAAWGALFAYTLATPSLSHMHIVVTYITIVVILISCVVVSTNQRLRNLCLIIFSSLSLSALCFSGIEHRNLLIILYCVYALIIYSFTNTLHAQFMRSMNNELKAKKYAQELEVLTYKLQLLSKTDGLTQICNRMHFDQCYKDEWRRASRQSYPLSLLLVDIDFFKAINDTFGHPFGDVCLKVIAQTLTKSMRRSSDIVARYGGEEFIILMPHANAEDAILSAQRILSAIREVDIPNDHQKVKLTCSIGVSTTTPKLISEIGSQDLINQVDIALYSAKNSGRDNYVVYNESITNQVLIL